MRHKVYISTFLKVLSGLFVLFLLLVAAANIWIVQSTKRKIFKAAADLPERNVALILGTSKFSRNGNPNQYFYYRIEAASKLYFDKKVRHFIVSGDNSLPYYNEPLDMKKALIKRGIPDSIITLDYAGFRTFDSVVRSKKVFKQVRIIIITQKFHLYRALFISDYFGIDATGFAANNIHERNTIITVGREILARFLAVLDLYIFQKEPKFLGKQETIPF